MTASLQLPSGKIVSRIIFGGDRLRARRFLFFPDPAKERQLFELLDAAVELGVTTFDTARAYGQSEQILGAWMASRGNRDQIVISTKLACPGPGQRSRLSPQEIRSDFETSLRELKTDQVDILFVHYDDRSLPVEPIMNELARFVERGQVGTLGASNWQHDRVMAANHYAAQAGQPGFSIISAHLGLVPWVHPPWPGACQLSGPEGAAARNSYAQAQMPVFVWSSLSFGFFADEYDPQVPRASFRSRWISRNFGSAENHARLERVRRYAREHNVPTPQLALASTLNQRFPTHCIVGCSSRHKLEDCVAALSVPKEIVAGIPS